VDQVRQHIFQQHAVEVFRVELLTVGRHPAQQRVPDIPHPASTTSQTSVNHDPRELNKQVLRCDVRVVAHGGEPHDGIFDLSAHGAGLLLVLAVVVACTIQLSSASACSSSNENNNRTQGAYAKTYPVRLTPPCYRSPEQSAWGEAVALWETMDQDEVNHNSQSAPKGGSQVRTALPGPKWRGCYGGERAGWAESAAAWRTSGGGEPPLEHRS
jgi:hypothetical protein